MPAFKGRCSNLYKMEPANKGCVVICMCSSIPAGGKQEERELITNATVDNCAKISVLLTF